MSIRRRHTICALVTGVQTWALPISPESALTIDEMLDNIMLYWLPNNGASSARLYWESADAFKGQKLDLPVGVTIFPEEIFRPSRRWAERAYPKLMHWNEVAKGGHFAAFEQIGRAAGRERGCQ